MLVAGVRLKMVQKSENEGSGVRAGAHSVKYMDLVRDCKFDKHPMLLASGYSADCTELWMMLGELIDT